MIAARGNQALLVFPERDCVRHPLQPGLLRAAFPIAVLPAARLVAEVSGIFCASANPAQVLVVVTDVNSTARKALLIQL